MSTPLRRTVTTTQPITGVIRDLVYFVKRLEAAGMVKFVGMVTDEQLVAQADAFWESAHGEDD